MTQGGWADRAYGSRAGRPILWTQGQFLGLLASFLVALVALIGSWYGASGQATLRQQLPYLAVATCGIAVLLAGSGVWFLQGRRAVGECRRFWVQANMDRDRTDPRRGRVSTERVEGGLVGGEGMTFYHRADCPLARDRSWPPRSLQQHLDAARRPCAVCRPPTR